MTEKTDGGGYEVDLLEQRGNLTGLLDALAAVDATTVALTPRFATGDGKESERNDREDTSQHVSTSKKR